MSKDTMYAVTIEGIRPLIMHNVRLSDPLDPFAKALKVASKKKDKSDADHEETSRIEFHGAAYWDDKIGPYIPADTLHGALKNGAKKHKLGQVFDSSAEVLEPVDAPGYRLEYDGPRDIKAMWANKDFVFRKSVKVQTSRVMRTRVRFATGWRVSFKVEVLEDALTQQQLEQAIRDAGVYKGIGSWVPRYGRFMLKSIKEVS